MTENSAEEVNADMLDVHILDILVQVEALLRGARQVQQAVLRMRGVPASLSNEDRDGAADDVRERLRRLLKECDSARDAVQEAHNTAAGLTGTHRAMRSEHSPVQHPE